METSEFSSELENLINRYRCHDKNLQDFSAVPERSSIVVRTFSVALRRLLSQQNKRFPESFQRILSAVVYGRAAQQRRQSFWKDFSAFHSTFKKYQSNSLLEVLNTLDSKISKFNSFFYLPTPEMTLHIGASILVQLFHLAKMQSLIVRLTNKLFGFLQMNHYEKLSIFIIGICADVVHMIPDQTRKICESYSCMSEFFTSLDQSFPKNLESFPIVKQLLDTGSINRLPDTNRILTMLNLTDEDLENAVIEVNIKKIRKEILDSQACDVVDLGASLSREEFECQSLDNAYRSRGLTDGAGKLDSVDSAIGLDTDTTFNLTEDDDVFAMKISRDTNRKRRRKIE